MAALLLLALPLAPAPRLAPVTAASLVGSWKAKYWEMDGVLHLRRDGWFGWVTADTVTAGTWGVTGGGKLWLKWQTEETRKNGKRLTAGFGDATDTLVRISPHRWALHKGGTAVLIFKGRAP